MKVFHSKKILSVLQSYQLFIILMVFLMVPFFAISVFNNPASDDFDFSYRTKLYSYFEVQFWRFNNEGGRCFSNGLLSMNPLVFHNFWLFKCIPIVILCLFIGALNFFFSNLLLGYSKAKIWASVGLILYLFLYQVPEVCSAFYWTTGAVTYQLSTTLLLFFSGFLIKYYRHQKLIHFILATLFLVLAIGCNEIVIVYLLVVAILYIMYRYIHFKKIDAVLAVLFVITLGFSAFEIMAPGNQVRSATIPIKHQILRSLVQTFLHSFSLILKWTPIVLICCLFFINTITNYISSLKNKYVLMHPIWAFFILFSSFYACMFIGFWSINQPLPNRALNVIYFLYIFMMLYFVITLINHLKEKYNLTLELDQNIKAIIGIVIVVFAFSNTPAFNAYHDVLTGRAYRYDKAIQERFDVIKKTTNRKVVLPPLVDTPPTIYNDIIMGLTNNKNDWKNLELSLYFDKEITVKPSDSTIIE